MDQAKRSQNPAFRHPSLGISRKEIWLLHFLSPNHEHQHDSEVRCTLSHAILDQPRPSEAFTYV